MRFAIPLVAGAVVALCACGSSGTSGDNQQAGAGGSVDGGTTGGGGIGGAHADARDPGKSPTGDGGAAGADANIGPSDSSTPRADSGVDWDSGACVPADQFPQPPTAAVEVGATCAAQSPCGGTVDGKSWQLESACFEQQKLFGRVTSVCSTASIRSVSSGSASGAISFAGGMATLELHASPSAYVDFPNNCSFCQCTALESRFAGTGLIASCSPVCSNGTCSCTIQAHVDVRQTGTYAASGNTLTIGSTTLDYCAGASALTTTDKSTSPKLGAATWGAPTPTPEKCDGIDNDLNGIVDDSPRDCPPCETKGVCAAFTATCQGASGWRCSYPNTYEAVETRCDGLDNDCDGQIDEPNTEVCNGRDDDCNGQTDENPLADISCVATKGPGYVCQGGSCVCAVTCGGTCVDIQSNVAHCGGCNQACASGASCSGGSCQCPPGQPNDCGTKCADLQTDAQNCGQCGMGCALACGNGSCLQVAKLALGSYSSCALMADGTARCWGNQWTLGTGGSATSKPTPVPTLASLGGLAVGGLSACTWTAAGSALCWGENSFGQLGDGTQTDHLRPAAVTALSSIAGMTAASQHACAWSGAGSGWCWGDGSSYQLGDGAGGTRPSPSPISLSSIAQLAAGLQHTCARTTGGTVACWGSNASGQLGLGASGTAMTPTAISGLSSVVEIGAGSLHTCARLSDKTVRCWGANGNGSVGDSTTSPRNTPTIVTGLASVEQIAVGGEHTCARLTDGTVRCWGWNQDGQIGDGVAVGRMNALSPTAVVGLTSVQEIAAGGQHTCARLQSGVVMCWGNNAFGQLGDGTSTGTATPTTVKW